MVNHNHIFNLIMGILISNLLLHGGGYLSFVDILFDNSLLLNKDTCLYP